MIHRRLVATLALTLIFVASRPVTSAEPGGRSWPVEQVRRVLETSLLPLVVDTVKSPPAFGIHAGPGGGVTVVDRTVIIVDPQGVFAAVADGGKTFRTLDDTAVAIAAQPKQRLCLERLHQQVAIPGGVKIL
jgi:hypothetical protein